MLGGNASRIADGEPPREPTAPRGPDALSQPLQLARIHQYLSMATPLLWTRQPDTLGVLGLALNACDGAQRRTPTRSTGSASCSARARPLGDAARGRDAGEDRALAGRLRSGSSISPTSRR